MSTKIIQLRLFADESNSTEESIKNMLRGLFARDTARKKELEKLMMRNMELEEIVFRMNTRIDRIAQGT